MVAAVVAIAGVSTKVLACCLFGFISTDLKPVCDIIRSRNSNFNFKTDADLVELLPLSTWRRTVRRVYLPPQIQLQRLEAWYMQYILNKAAFVDTTIPGKLHRLVRGDEEGLQKFAKVLNSQLELVRKGMLSGEQCTAL